MALATFALAPLQCPAESAAEKALRAMKTADGFRVRLVASEPEIRQPLSISFDHQGRLWVIQYLQYPSPAGLKPVKIDQYLRTTYDRVPEPPPRGPKGADRITICEDTDGDGHMDKFKDFISDLNLCSGMALGYDGVFVMQPPYLLYYADKNHDDVPDGDPEVLLSGFGMEDAHALANSLTWGPDGWLYGAQGSTVTAHIRGLEFQQAIWRYHPVTHAFEVFAEGGGNTWGLDFDDDGEILAGTNYLEKMLHMVQGGYYIKSFGKHGELHNPHAYGYFDHVPYSGYRGLHLSVGGIVYHGGAFPARFKGTYIYANLLDHAIYWADMHRAGSSFTAAFGGALLKTDDELFRPVDCQVGPDGAVYVADWCDKRASHVDPLDTWDRSNGRIYKIEPTNASAKAANRFLSTSIPEPSKRDLIQGLAHTNDWFRREARQLIAERRDPALYPGLTSNVLGNCEAHLQLESLWALYSSGGFDAKLAAACLRHPNPMIRKWAARLLGDSRAVTSEQRAGLVELARSEPDARVRSQLASTAKRLPATDSLPIIRELLLRHDEADPFIPLLVWWAIEEKAVSNRAEVVKLFSLSDVRSAPLARQYILERLARRYAAEATQENLDACARLLTRATPAEQELLLKGMDKGLTAQQISSVPDSLKAWVARSWANGSSNLLFITVAARLGDSHAKAAAMELVDDEKRRESDRLKAMEVVSENATEAPVRVLLNVFANDKSLALRKGAVNALRRHADTFVVEELIRSYPRLPADLRVSVIDVLCSRAASAHSLVAAVERGEVARMDVSREMAAKMTTFKDEALTQKVQQLWGKVGEDTPAEKQNFISQAKLILKPSGAVGRVPTPDLASGKKLFQENCGVCHKLHGEGNNIGPDLNGVDRKNTDFLFTNIVDPSAYIRPEYVAYDLETTDDESLSGLMAESTPSAVSLVDRTNQRHTIPRARIRWLKESTKSLMPEGLLENLKPQQLIDLIGYLQAE